VTEELTSDGDDGDSSAWWRWQWLQRCQWWRQRYMVMVLVVAAVHGGGDTCGTGWCCREDVWGGGTIELGVNGSQ
jgi:hypothetical protein